MSKRGRSNHCHKGPQSAGSLDLGSGVSASSDDTEDPYDWIFRLEEKYEFEEGEQTIPVLRGILRYVEKHRPALVYLENVTRYGAIVFARLNKSFMDKVHEWFVSKGYAATNAELCPTRSGVPNTRPRIHDAYVNLQAPHPLMPKGRLPVTCMSEAFM